MVGALVALLASLSFSLSNITVRRGMAQVPASQGALATVVLGVPLFLFASIVTGQIFHVTDLALSSYGLLAVAGLIHFVVGRYFNYASIGAIGAARAGPVNALGLPYSVLIALIFLDEGVNAGMVAGIGLIMMGPAVMVERPRRAPVATTTVGGAAPEEDTTKPEVFQLRQVEGYFYAIAAAVCYGTSPILIRAALEDESGVSVLGGFVSYFAAGAFLLASLALPSRRHLSKALAPESVRLFAAPALFVGVAQLLRFLALSLASVAVVATLMRFGSVFTLVLSWIVNRDLEKITWRVVAGVSVSVVGAVLLVIASN